MSRDQSRRNAAARALFVLYAAALATATHWPGLAVASPGGLRLDIFIHAGVFGAWTLLLSETGWPGARRTRPNAVRSTLIALAYAALDEVTQGLPAVNRTVDPADLVANAVGVLVIGALLWWRSLPAAAPPPPGP